MITFNNLEEAKQAIEQWFRDCGYDVPDTDEKQKAKIFEEIAELEAEIESSDIEKRKSEAGDVFVTLVGKELKDGNSLDVELTGSGRASVNLNLKLLFKHTKLEVYWLAVEYLNDICISLDINLLECATIAYNKIQGRLERGELKVKNGTITKGN